MAVKEHLDAETRCSQGASCYNSAVAYNVFSTSACGEKPARLWFTEEAMTGRTNESTPGVPLARLSGAVVA